MRVLLSSNHQFPASGEVGSGPHPKLFPSGSGHRIQDLIVKGLAELGHDVFYLLPEGATKPLPKGARLVSAPLAEIDIFHNIAYRDEYIVEYMESIGKPWVTTCHMDLRVRGRAPAETTENWIFVSKTMAESLGRERYVLNGIDPEQYIYSETKDDYLLFMSSMDWALDKGLDTALSLSKESGLPLVVAGTAGSYEVIHKIAEMCEQSGARYVGDVQGRQKAELLAGAAAFLFPSKLAEAFGLVMVEALISGTPVICSDRGACPEIISPDVGFVCSDRADYLKALESISSISPKACREKAMRDYHYLRMAADYIREYERELASPLTGKVYRGNSSVIHLEEV